MASWHDHALCREIDPELFFPDVDRPTTGAAKRICARCLVRGECLTEAITNDEQHGIWGGLSRTERGKHTESQNQAQQGNTSDIRAA